MGGFARRIDYVMGGGSRLEIGGSWFVGGVFRFISCLSLACLLYGGGRYVMQMR
jgi:hypothetical protein